jgi:hypothetical protein
MENDARVAHVVLLVVCGFVASDLVCLPIRYNISPFSRCPTSFYRQSTAVSSRSTTVLVDAHGFILERSTFR